MMNIELFAGAFMALVACLLVPIFLVDALRDARRWRRPTSAQLTRWMQTRAWRVAVPVLAVMFLCSLVLGPESIAAQMLKGGTGVRIIAGPAVDTATAATPATALTIAQGDVWLSKNGAAAATKNQADSCTHIKHGFYACSLNSTDTNTDGTLDVMIKESGSLIMWRHLMVIDGTVYDADVTGSDYRKIDIAQIQGTAPTTASAGTLAVSATSANVTAIQGTAPSTASAGVLNVKATTAIASATGLDAVLKSSTFALAIADAIWEEAARTLTALDEDTTTIDLDGSTVGGLTTWDKTGYSIADATSDAVIAHAVWGADATTYQTQGTFGQAIGDPVADADTIWALCNTNLDTTISSRGTSTLTQTQVTGGAYSLDTDANGRVRIVDGTGAGELDTDTGRVISDLVYIHGTALTETAGQLAGRFVNFFDQAAASYTIATALADFKATGFSTLASADVSAAVWNAATVTYGTAGSYGLLVETNLDAVLSARTLAAADYFLFGTDAVANVTLVGTLTTYTGNTPQTADNNTILASGVHGNAALRTLMLDVPTVAEFEARSLVTADYFVVGDYTAPLDAAGVRAAVGLAAANLDTQLADIPTVAEFEARTLLAASYFDSANDTVARVTLCDTITTYTNNTLQTGDSFARLGAPAGASIAADLVAVQADLDDPDQYKADVTAVTVTSTPDLLLSTTAAVVNSQTSFTLTAGSDDDDAYNGCTVVMTDASNSSYPSIRRVTDYVGATKTVTINVAPVFTLIAGDGVKVFAFREGSMGGP